MTNVMHVHPRAFTRRAHVIGAIAIVVGASAVEARTQRVPAREGAATAALQRAAAGDTILLEAGTHRGSLVVDRAVVLRGDPGAIVDAGGRGTVITVTASDAVVEDLTLIRSGSDVMKVDAAVRVALADRVRLQRLTVSDVLYGINAERTTRLEIRDCRMRGRVAPLDESGEGNGLHFWYSTGARIAGNRIERFLDAIYLSFAHHLDVRDNRLENNGRYGLHTMYCQENRLERNVFTSNVAGCALMFSNRLVVHRNEFVRNRGSRTYGLLLRDCSDGEFTDNRLAENTIAVFMDGSNRNRFHANLVENNGWGLFVFASSANNEFSGNQFVQNDYPVALDMRRTSNRFDDGRTGNYWSESAAWDLDGDGIGDAPHGPVTAFAFVSKQYPDLTVLAKSPGVAALGVAERAFPAMRPSEAVDRFPLVRPARAARAIESGGTRAPSTRPAWEWMTAFLALGGGGLTAMVAGTQRRRATW